jgi:hypothetical protein
LRHVISRSPAVDLASIRTTLYKALQLGQLNSAALSDVAITQSLCHRGICTWPVWRRPIARAAAGDKSMSRPRTKHASIVADVDQCPKRKRAVRRPHCGTVEVLAARSKMTTPAVAVAVDASHFSVRRRASSKQRERNNRWGNRPAACG